MTNKITLVFFSLFMFSYISVSAQNKETEDMINCKSSEVSKHFFDQNPDELIKYQKFNEFTREFVKNSENKKVSSSAYTIPVVFHVYGNVQNGKAVNLNTIVNSLKQVNDDFNGLNDDYNSIDANFDGIKSTLDINFELAKIDPNGKCTTGVVFYPEEFGMGNYNSPAVARDNWDNSKYMNVYITGDLYADGVITNSGVAWYPSSNMSNAGIARVVMNGQYLTGNTTQEFASTLSHEFGHWLNLIHTHEGGCSGTDEVGDTPQDTRANNGNCSETSDCGTIINYENYMGYNGSSGCYKMFTIGQINRMTAALTHTSRQPLWQTSNLTATGVNNPAGRFITSGSMNIPESPTNNGSIASTTNITITNTIFSVSGNLTAGVHFNSTMPAGLTAHVNVLSNTQAELTITGNATNHTEIDNQNITIEFLAAATDDSLDCDALNWKLLFLDPYKIVYVDNNDISVNSNNVWQSFTDPYITSSGTGTNYGGLFYNLNGHVSGQPALQFETYNESMVCEGTSKNISMLPINTLIRATSNWIDGAIYPNLLTIRSTSYTVWDGETNFAGFRFTKNGLKYHGWFRFQVSAAGNTYTLIDYAYSTEPNGDIYTGQTSLSVDTNSLQHYDLNIYPNPFNNNININTKKLKGEKIMVEIRNILGQSLFSKTYNNVSSKVTIANFEASAGIYFITVSTDNENGITQKIVKK